MQLTNEQIAGVAESAADLLDATAYNPRYYEFQEEGKPCSYCEVGALSVGLARVVGLNAADEDNEEMMQVLRALHPDLDQEDLEQIASPWVQADLYFHRVAAVDLDVNEPGRYHDYCPVYGDWREAHEPLARLMRETAARLTKQVKTDDEGAPLASRLAHIRAGLKPVT